MPTDIPLPSATSVLTLVINMVLAAALTSLLAWQYTRFGRTLTNRAALARILPFIALVTALVIFIVKSSLALSLGLVGALSIVRFRTPIKEPEELAYLFMAIAVGLGLGAEQRIITVTAFAMIFGFLMLWSHRGPGGASQHLYLNVEFANNNGREINYDDVQQLLTPHVRVADLRRLDSENGTTQATFYIDCRDDRAVLSAMDNLRKNLPHASISLIDRQQGLGL
jgi:hypothetical protein